MNDIGLRIKQLRELLSLTQTEFGQKLGLSYTSIGMYENQKRSVSETVKKSICREFNVNYLWLVEGIGDIFSDIPGTILDELALQYNLTDDEKKLVKKFCTLSEDHRKILIDFFRE